MKTEIIDYYVAFEKVLEKCRKETNDFRTHFGIMPQPKENYCWFKAVSESNENKEMISDVLESMNKLHDKTFNQKYHSKRILDVGCGSGGTLLKLAIENPSCKVDGININPTQIEIAKKITHNQSNSKIIFGDIYNYNFEEKYDLIYFIESAFHMKDKENLLKKIASLLNTNGEIIFVDIFYPETLWNRLKQKKTKEEIFDYLSVSEWNIIASKNNLRIESFNNISRDVANHLQINMTSDYYNEKILNPLFDSYENKEDLKINMHHALVNYKKLHLLFKKEILQYGILKLRINA